MLRHDKTDIYEFSVHHASLGMIVSFSIKSGKSVLQLQKYLDTDYWKDAASFRLFRETPKRH